jgi:hypothetical protein
MVASEARAPEQQPPRLRLATAVALVSAGVLLASCGGGDKSDSGAGGGDTKQQAAQRAAKTQQRLDGSMTSIFNDTDVVVHVAFACLSRASHINAYGGPQLAKCEPTAKKAAVNLRRKTSRLGRIYRSSPSILRRIYRDGFRSLQRVLSIHAQEADAMADWARVHGGSSYAGAAEFQRIKTQIASGRAADNRHLKRMKQARGRWHRYAKRNWGVR